MVEAGSVERYVPGSALTLGWWQSKLWPLKRPSLGMTMASMR